MIIKSGNLCSINKSYNEHSTKPERRLPKDTIVRVIKYNYDYSTVRPIDWEVEKPIFISTDYLDKLL